MSQGLPVLCGDACPSIACFTDEESGLVFERDSFEHFRAQLRRLVTDDELRERLRSAAHREAVDHLLPEVWAERFEQLVAERPPRLWRRLSA